MKVLIAEDDPHTRAALAELLCDEGYEVVTAADGAAALEQFASERPDFVCLDVMMPRRSGYDVCRQLRAQAPDVPIVFITAKAEEIDKVVGLEIGGDDYIVKPFGVKEVMARIRAVARRAGAVPSPREQSASFWMHDLEVLPRQLRARRNSETIDLSPREVRILQLLYENAGAVVDRHRLMDHCWGEGYLPASRTIDQHISQLRKRIEQEPSQPKIIQTVHGAGYRFDPVADL